MQQEITGVLFGGKQNFTSLGILWAMRNLSFVLLPQLQELHGHLRIFWTDGRGVLATD